MTNRSWLPILTLFGLMLAGCAADGTHSAQTADAGVIRGTVSYRERLALPPDAVVDLWLTDVSPLIMILPLIAETAVLTEGRQVPIPFELRYDPSKIAPDHAYGVRAAIRSSEGILFATDTAANVITQNNPTQVDLWLQRVSNESSSGSGGLPGTAWRLEDLGGAGVLNRIEATLEFAEAGKVSGNGSCNRYFGTVEFSGDSIKFGPLGSTRMACVEAVGIQEGKYLKALQNAERLTLNGTTLLIYCAGLDKPLRFVRKEP